MIEQYNRVKETPQYQVKRKKAKELADGRPHKLLHIGVYQSQQYGITAYADTQEGEDRVRFSLPKYMIDTVDEMSHDDETMRQVHDGHAGIIMTPYTTKNGFQSLHVKFVTLQ